jgi:hypothetical protein
MNREVTGRGDGDLSASAGPIGGKDVKLHISSLPGICWTKSSHSFGNGDCVETAPLPGGHVAVRDSKDKAGPVLLFTPSEWRAFVGGVKGGEFDILG